MIDVSTACPSFGELADYWTVDAAPADVERIESHVFECARCARLLADAEALCTGIGALVRTGGVQAFVTDALLNRLARDGVRVRQYALGPGDSIRCAVWDEDEVVVARLRGQFAGAAAMEAEMRLENGEPWGLASDVPVPAGATELVLAFPAEALRRAPLMTMRLTLRAAPGTPDAAVLAEYVFNHEGSLSRAPE